MWGKEWIKGIKAKRAEAAFANKLQSLIGQTVTKIEPYEENEYCLVITFSNGARLTAEDGEYGTDAFELLQEDVK